MPGRYSQLPWFNFNLIELNCQKAVRGSTIHLEVAGWDGAGGHGGYGSCRAHERWWRLKNGYGNKVVNPIMVRSGPILLQASCWMWVSLAKASRQHCPFPLAEGRGNVLKEVAAKYVSCKEEGLNEVLLLGIGRSLGSSQRAYGLC